MELKIAYVGKDTRYFTSIKRELDDLYGGSDTYKFVEIWEEAEGAYKGYLKKSPYVSDKSIIELFGQKQTFILT